jgi:hypothetical protein
VTYHRIGFPVIYGSMTRPHASNSLMISCAGGRAYVQGTVSRPGFAALRFENAARRNGTWPVAYPADKQTDVPLNYGAEFPNPIPNHGTGGYPITLQFPPFDKVTGVSAKLAEATGNPVEFFLSDPEHPATSFGQFGVICLIPKMPLQAQHAYTVRVDASWKGKCGTWTWSFSTGAAQGRSVR